LGYFKFIEVNAVSLNQVNIKKHIPNTLTLCNLCLGFLSITESSRGDFVWGALFIFAALIPDFLDGLVARVLKVASPIGKDLDSLADMVSFGLAPAFLIFQFGSNNTELSGTILKYLPVLFAAFAALRLAKFNNDERQSDDFYGLATPSASLFLASLPLIYEQNKFDLGWIAIQSTTLCISIIVLSVLMVSNVRLFSLKVKNLKWRGNEYRYTLLILAVIYFTIFGYWGIPFLIITYLILSLFRNFAE
jgi:CDP-diacylglycerol--serine O-phosphatidyltransferase